MPLLFQPKEATILPNFFLLEFCLSRWLVDVRPRYGKEACGKTGGGRGRRYDVQSLAVMSSHHGQC